MLSVIKRLNWVQKVTITSLCFIGLLLVSTLLPTGLRAGNERVITVYYDGIEQTVITDAATVKEVLERAKVDLHDHDTVEPAVNTELTAPAYNVNVYRARPVTVVDGPQRHTVMTPHTSAREIVSAAGLELYPEDITEISRIDDIVREGAVGLKLSIDRAIPVTMVLYGKKADIRTQATTVGELLKEKKVTLGESDGTNLPAHTPITAGLTIEVWRNGVQTITQEQEVAFTTKQIRDTSKPIGFKEVQKPGVKGQKLVTYQVELRDGQEVSRAEIQSVVTKQPEEQIEVIGGAASGKYTTNDEILYDLRMCEAGGIYTRNSGNDFYGAYQFMISTWDRIAQRVRPDLVGVRPDLAAPADQDFMVLTNARLSSGGFATQHPGCYKKLGLPAKPF